MRLNLIIVFSVLLGPLFAQDDNTLAFNVEKKERGVETESLGTLEAYVDTLARYGYVLETPNPQGMKYELVNYHFLVVLKGGLAAHAVFQSKLPYFFGEWESFSVEGIHIRTANGQVLKMKSLKFGKMAGM